jgi:hypothetical protein
MKVLRSRLRPWRGLPLVAVAVLLLASPPPVVAARVTQATNTPTFNDKIKQPSAWQPHQITCYQFVGNEWGTTYDYMARQITQEMAKLKAIQIAGGAVADLPTVYEPCNPVLSGTGEDPNGLNIELMSSGLGQTAPYNVIKFNKSPSPVWCQDFDTRSGDCLPIDAGLVHELGHSLGLDHSFGTAKTSMSAAEFGATRMNMGLMPARRDTSVARVFGTCDVAGLQARFGLRSQTSILSTCFKPTFAPTWSITPSGLSITAKATVNWGDARILTTWYTSDIPSIEKNGSFERITGLTGQKLTLELWQRLSAGDVRRDVKYATSGTNAVFSGLSAYASYYVKLVGFGTKLPTKDSPLVYVS